MNPSPEIQILLISDDLLNFTRDLQVSEKMATFAELEKDFKATQLLHELNAENEGGTG